MAWALAAGDEHSPDRGRLPMHLTFDHGGQVLDIRLSPLEPLARDGCSRRTSSRLVRR